MRLFHGSKPHNDLWKECDERTRFSSMMIDAVRKQPRLT